MEIIIVQRINHSFKSIPLRIKGSPYLKQQNKVLLKFYCQISIYKRSINFNPNNNNNNLNDNNSANNNNNNKNNNNNCSKDRRYKNLKVKVVILENLRG